MLIIKAVSKVPLPFKTNEDMLLVTGVARNRKAWQTTCELIMEKLHQEEEEEEAIQHRKKIKSNNKRRRDNNIIIIPPKRRIILVLRRRQLFTMDARDDEEERTRLLEMRTEGDGGEDEDREDTMTD